MSNSQRINVTFQQGIWAITLSLVWNISYDNMCGLLNYSV